MIRWLACWLARAEIEQLETLNEALGDAIVRLQARNCDLRARLTAAYSRGVCPDRPLCTRTSDALQKLQQQKVNHA